MEDFRKADPTYTNFQPRTAEEAINKFYRRKNLGVPPNLWPEVFVECASRLKGEELEKFESWIVNPEGELSAVDLTQVDRENELLRQRLCAEAEARDRKLEMPEIKADYCDEKSPAEFEMITHSER